MSLTPAERRRFVRHLLLPEVGPRGQELLRDATFSFSEERAANEVATLYLTRAGLREDPAGACVELADSDDPIDAALFGAWGAVEHIKQLLGLGRSVPRPPKWE